jgi:hypothetical protein
LDTQPLRRELEDGLILRSATNDDLDGMVDLLRIVFRQGDDGPPKPECAPWARDLGSGRHPFTGFDRLYIVEDPAAGKIVSCTWIIPMRWSYDGVEFGVARPEMVGTHPDYRGRGLVRHIFGAIHERSTQDGDLVQAITGIPYYYRQYGYEYALELGGGQRVGFENIPSLTPGTAEPYRIAPAADDDVPFMMDLYDRRRQRSLVSPVLTESYWQWMTSGINHESGLGWLPLIVRDGADRAVGFALGKSRRWGNSISVVELEVEDGIGLHQVRDPLLRHLKAMGATLPAMPYENPGVARDVSFALGTSHPVYDVLTPDLRPTIDEPYAWFLRVPDLAAFMLHIAPVLESRLTASGFAGYTGDLVIDCYRGELALSFAGGTLTDAQSRRRNEAGTPADAAFPPLVFLQLLFGRRSFDELHSIMPDVWARPNARLLLAALFPVRASSAHPIT